jgi:hypothetical protein
MNIHLIHIKGYHLNNQILKRYVSLTLQWQWCLNSRYWSDQKGMKLIVVLNASMTYRAPRPAAYSYKQSKERTVHRGRQWRVKQNETMVSVYTCESSNINSQQSNTAQQFVYPWCTPLQPLKPLVLVPTFSTNKMPLSSSNNTLRVCEITNWISYYRTSLSFSQCMVRVVIQQSIVCITTFCQGAYSFLLLLSLY